MTPKGKRAYNAARASILKLCHAATGDHETSEALIGLLASSLGAYVGSQCAADGRSVEEMRAILQRVVNAVQNDAAKTYSHYLAAEQAAAPKH